MEKTTKPEKREATSVTPTQEQTKGNFLLLTTLTFGVYQIYWGWKAWETIEKVDPNKRHTAILGFFLPLSSFWLFPRILKHAKAAGYGQSYTPALMAILLLVANMIAGRDVEGESFLAALATAFIGSLLCGVFILPAWEARNYLVKHHKPAISEPPTNKPLIYFMVALVAIAFIFGILLAVNSIV